jgi:IS4 transposase
MFAVVLDQFVQQCPLTVMARMTLQRALRPEWVDALFESHREWQYTRELTFSTVVDITSLVALGMSPSLHAAARRDASLTVSMAALYAKVNRTEPALLRALVRGSAEQLLPVVEPLRAGRTPLLPGFRIRVVDGNHLPASDKRLAPLRDFRGAALPGHALVVFDPELGLAVDLIPCEDAYASERVLMPAAMEAARAGDLWLADRHFSTRPILLGLVARNAHFIIREHKAHPNPTAVWPRKRIGRSETGVVFAQRVTIPTADGGVQRLRRIEIELYEPTSDGETLIRLLTNLPKATADARTVALLYLERWTVENLFQRLESALHSEVRTLGKPRAALLMFATAVVAFNVLSVLQSSVETAHALAPEADVVSTWHLAQEVRSHYVGMMVALPAAGWTSLVEEAPEGFTRTLLRFARHVDLRHIRKNPRKPKVAKPKGYAPRKDVQRHISTARVLANGGVR